MVAGIGGILVFAGLWMEGPPKEGTFSDACAFKHAKRGWNLLMLGIFVEIVVAMGFAANDGWQARQMQKQIAANDPRNLPLAAVIAYVAIAYNTNTAETNVWEPVLSMMIRSNVVPGLSLMSSTGESLELSSSTAEASTLGGVNGLIYIRRFDWDVRTREWDTELQELTGRMRKHTNEFRGSFADSVVGFSIGNLPFRHKTEITGGKVELFFNGTVLKKFLMPPQRIAGPPWEVLSDPNPFWQRQLGATNWSYIGRSGMLQTTSLPRSSLRSIAISNETWLNVGIPQ